VAIGIRKRVVLKAASIMRADCAHEKAVSQRMRTQTVSMLSRGFPGRSVGTARNFDGCKRLPLALGHAASQLLDLLLFLSAGSGPRRLGGGLLAGGAFQILTFQLVFDFCGVGHV
jgi:hypothetical protein